MLDENIYTVKELILYYSQQKESIVGVVSEELFQAIEIVI